jgi:ABC-2 type transport system permease protein
MFRKIFHISANALRLAFRDKGALIWIIVMPLIWTVLMGSMTGRGSSTSTIPVGLINNDKGAYGEMFSDALSAEKGITVQKQIDVESMKSLVKNQRIAIGLVIPEIFSQDLMSNEPVTIQMFKSTIASTYFLEELVNKTADRISIDALAANFAVEKVSDFKILAPNQKTLIYEGAFKMADQTFEPSPSIGVNYEVLSVQKTNENMALGMDLSSPGFAAMFVMMGIFFAGAAMVAERQNGTLARLLTAPLSKFTIISGEMLGFFFLGLIQFAILILFGQFALGVSWGNSPIGILLLVLSYLLAITGLGMLLAVFVRTSAQAGAFAVLLSIVTSMLGGAWWPIEITPAFMQNIAKFTPQYWVIDGFNKIITRGFGYTTVLSDVYILLIIGGFSLIFATLFFRFE